MQLNLKAMYLSYLVSTFFKYELIYVESSFWKKK